MNSQESITAPNGISVTFNSKCLIDGKWIGAASGKTFEVYNPVTESSICSVPLGQAEDIDRAVKAARQAFEERRWLRFSAHERSRILWRVSEILEKRCDEFAALDALNMGMPFEQLRSAQKAVDAFQFYAGWCTKISGETVDLDNGEQLRHAFTLREPLGVAGLIVPWNAPMPTAAWKIAPALAAGCTVVLKPAEETPLTALLLGEVLMEAGVPDGVVNIVTGLGVGAGAALTHHDDVDKISFTGSTEIGREIVRASATNFKRVTLELGGKSPFIIREDADIENAVQAAAIATFSNAGQMCVAGSRVLAHRSICDAVAQGLGAIANYFPIGDSFDDGTVTGPLISAKQLNRVAHLVEGCIAEGGKVVAGGSPADRAGYFFPPTVLSGVDSTMQIVKQEIFGPVITITPFDSDEEALSIANDTPYGLSSYLWTRDLSKAHYFAKRIRAGNVWINSHLVMEYQMPFGGYKQSGWGREGGRDGVDAFLETKAVSITL